MVSAMVAGTDPRFRAHVWVFGGGPMADVMTDTVENRFRRYGNQVRRTHGWTKDDIRERLRTTIETDPVAPRRQRRRARTSSSSSRSSTPPSPSATAGPSTTRSAAPNCACSRSATAARSSSSPTSSARPRTSSAVASRCPRPTARPTPHRATRVMNTLSRARVRGSPRRSPSRPPPPVSARGSSSGRGQRLRHAALRAPAKPRPLVNAHEVAGPVVQREVLVARAEHVRAARPRAPCRGPPRTGPRPSARAPTPGGGPPPRRRTQTARSPTPLAFLAGHAHEPPPDVDGLRPRAGPTLHVAQAFSPRLRIERRFFVGRRRR